MVTKDAIEKIEKSIALDGVVVFEGEIMRLDAEKGDFHDHRICVPDEFGHRARRFRRAASVIVTGANPALLNEDGSETPIFV